MQCYLTRGPFEDVYDAASSRRKLCPADQHFFDLINQGASCGDLLSAVQSGANINAAIYSVSDEGNDGFYFDGNLTLLQSLCEEEEIQRSSGS